MDNQLVSIVVFTYNSAKYVLETLESARKQTYSNIELIISDDGSTDDTVNLCRDWLGKWNKRFVRAELLTSLVNTGIPANFNRGYKVVQGNWIKGIAGDDVLKEDAIEQFIRSYNGDAYIVETSYQELLLGKSGRYFIGNAIFPSQKEICLCNLPVELQYKKILWSCFIAAPTIFLKRDLFNLVGYYDERYRLMEDWPFWLKCLEYGYRIDFLPILTVYYRNGHESVTSNTSHMFYNDAFYKTEQTFIRNEIYPKISLFNFLYWEDRIIMKLRHYVLVSIFQNKKNAFSNRVASYILFLSFQRLYMKISGYVRYIK